MQPYTSLDCEPLESVRAAYTLCYPHPASSICAATRETLRSAGVRGLLFWGQSILATPIGPIRVLGKGHSSVVVATCTRRGILALKTRRTDSKRESLAREARLLNVASRHGASPQVYWWSSSYILMDLVPGPSLGEALEEYTQHFLIARRALEAARALDTADILHLELSRPQHHVLFNGNPLRQSALIIDLESASKGECGNASKIAGYLARFLGRDPRDARGLLRRYRSQGCPEDLYTKVMEWLLGSR